MHHRIRVSEGLLMVRCEDFVRYDPRSRSWSLERGGLAER